MCTYCSVTVRSLFEHGSLVLCHSPPVVRVHWSVQAERFFSPSRDDISRDAAENLNLVPPHAAQSMFRHIRTCLRTMQSAGSLATPIRQRGTR